MALPLFFSLGFVIILSTILAYIAKALRQPLIIAYVIAGFILGPSFLGIVSDPTDIAILSELGIAFLLFAVGLEIDIQRLRVVGPAAIVGGIVQIALMFSFGLMLSLHLGFNIISSVYLALLLSFSSTMIVAKLLTDQYEISTIHGRIMLGILIIQDITVILLLPFLSNISHVLSFDTLGLIVLKGLGLFSIALVLNRFVFTKLLDYAAKTKEVLFFTAVSTCFGFIAFAYALGFSIAIGAFLGGLALAKFPYNVEVFGEIRSLRDFFSVLFFASLGMQLSVVTISYLVIPFFVFFFTLILLKPLILTLIYLFLGYGGRTSLNIGLGLGQASEFSFIIAAQGLLLGHITPETYSILIALIVLSIITTPYFIQGHERFYNLLRRIIPHKFTRPKHIRKLELTPKKGLKDHVVLFGCGVTGCRIASYLEKKKVPFIVIDHDPDVIKWLGQKGIYCLYGEADNEELLHESGLYKAKLAVVTIPDIEEACFAIRKAKRFNKNIKILARALTQEDSYELLEAGADYVIIPKIVSAIELEKAIGKFLKS